MNPQRSATPWLSNVEDILAENWSRFVDCPERMKRLGPFLARVLAGREKKPILDAAMGIGCETVWLAERGFDITGNEISPGLRAIADRRAAGRGVSFKTSAVDWRALGDTVYDTILLLGNSFSLMHEERERKVAAEALRKACGTDGQLIVDERNFEYIMTNQLEILAGRFRYSGKVMYCGEEVQGRPIGIATDCVQFGYFEGKKCIGTLDMHPFRAGGLVALFWEAGFATAEVFSDLSRGFSEEADFFTYILRP